MAGAVRELREAPWPLLLEVLGLRAYGRTKRVWDAADDKQRQTMKRTAALKEVIDTERAAVLALVDEKQRGKRG